jgi:hypothetical protein
VRCLQQDREERIAPEAPDGWASGVTLRRSYYLGKSNFNQKLAEFRQELVRDIVASGVTAEEAEALVDHNLIGYRRTKNGGKTALHLSPNAVEILERENQIRRKPEFGTEAIDTVRKGLIGDMIRAGLQKEEAMAIVDRHVNERILTLVNKCTYNYMTTRSLARD